MFSRGPHNAGSAVRDLRDDNRTGDFGRTFPTVGATILFAPEQHIPGHRSLDARKESAVFRHERHGDASLSAETEKKRAARDLPETYDASDRVDWNVKLRLLFLADKNGFSLAGEIRALRRDIERIEQAFQDDSSSPDSRCAAEMNFSM